MEMLKAVDSTKPSKMERVDALQIDNNHLRVATLEAQLMTLTQQRDEAVKVRDTFLKEIVARYELDESKDRIDVKTLEITRG